MAPNSRYRESVTPLSIGKVKPVTADVEADELEEPNPGAGKRKGLCCTVGRPAKRLKRVFNRAAQVGPPRYRGECVQCMWWADENRLVKRIFVWRLDGGGWFIPTMLTLEAEITIIIAKTPKTGVTGKPFNIASYALLTMMVAQVCDLEVGEFVHTLGDAHLYSNHFDQVKLQLSRTPGALPVMKINPDVRDLFAFTFDDFTLEGYEAEASIAAPIAV